MTEFTCPHCCYNNPIIEQSCRHCGSGPSRFPNVELARRSEETKALEDRYCATMQDAQARNADTAVRDFELAVSSSSAVLNRRIGDLEWLAESDHRLYSVYFQQRDRGFMVPEGEKWDILRGAADEALYQHKKTEIRVAALTMDGVGVLSYGECSLVLKEQMIAHRTIVFDPESILIPQSHAFELPYGYRAVWSERGKLAVAKLAARIHQGTQPREYPGLLLKPGGSIADDVFVEVHIWGPLTIRAVERVIIGPCRLVRGDRTRRNRLRRTLEKYAVPLEELP